MPKKSFSPDIKIMAVRYLEEGLYTGQEICKMFHVSETTLYEWHAKYEFGGVTELIRPPDFYSSRNKNSPKTAS
ncbi:helix-turn-helix domain-containing protein [Caldibacillus debilis]